MFFEVAALGGKFRIGGEVAELLGVVLHVVEFGEVMVGRAVAMRVAHELPRVGADAADVGRVGKLFLVVVFVKPGRAPRGVVAVGEGAPRAALDSGERGRAAEVKEARGEVHGEDLTVDDAAGGETGAADDEGDADARLVHGAFVDHAVLAFEETVVAHEDDDGVGVLAGGFEVGDEAADAVVDAEHGAPVGADHGLEIDDGLGAGIGKCFTPFEERTVNAVPGGEALADPVGFAVEGEGTGGIGNLHMVEGGLVFLFWEIKRVRRLLADGERPRLAGGGGGAGLEPVEGVVGDDVGVVALGGFVAQAVDAPLGVEVFALALVGDEPVEAGAGGVVVFTHVPFADIGGGVAAFAQAGGPVRERGGEFGEIIADAVAMGIEAGENARAARGAK